MHISIRGPTLKIISVSSREILLFSAVIEAKCLLRASSKFIFFNFENIPYLPPHNLHNEGSNISDENGIYFFFHLHLWVHLRRNLSQHHTYSGTQIHAKAIKNYFTTDERENDSNKFLVWVFFWSIKQSTAVGWLVSLWRDSEKKLQASAFFHFTFLSTVRGV